MKVRVRKFRSEVIKESLEKDGACVVDFKGGTLMIAKQNGKFEITLRYIGETPDVWHYRRERIALDRFSELCDSISRRRS